jgi:hypothetical protein
MALNFKVREARAPIASLGKVVDIVGKGGKVEFLPNNYVATDRRLVACLIKADGTEEQITCSQPVSDGIRSKEISLNQLFGFEVKEQVSSAGEVYNQINMPDNNAGRISFNADDITVEEFKVEALTEEKIKNLISVSL